MSAPIEKEYCAIHEAWDNNVSSSDVYHMILYWLEKWGNRIIDEEAVEDILRRMEEGDSTNDIVEDFIYGECYAQLRAQFNCS
jgi:hypothetical protein